MTNRMKFSDDLYVAAQPSAEELRSLNSEGFRSVVNFRTDGEDDQPLSPAAEGELVIAHQMQYLHVPVSMGEMSEDIVNDFRGKFESLPKPTLAHCKSGKRAGAMMMMHVASEQGMSGDEALAQAEQMGFECDQQELRDFVKNYVDHHTRSQV